MTSRAPHPMSGHSCVILSIGDRTAWEAATEDVLPGQRWSHAAGLAAAGWEPRLAVIKTDDGRLVLPFLVRAHGKAADIATLPGLSGALLEGNGIAPLRIWTAYAKAQGWVSGYLQLAPVENGLSHPDLAREGLGQITAHNALFIFDLALWDIDRSVGANMRRSIRLGDRMGARLVTDPARIAGSFLDLHAQTLARSHTPAPFEQATIDRWFALPDTLAFAAEVEGAIVAAQLGRRGGAWADLHLAGATGAGRPFQAWLIAAALTDLRKRGLRHANIGGYGEAGDGLHRMKSRLGARQEPLRSLRQVYDPDRFARLCSAAGVDPGDGYFPPYRRPPQSRQS